MEINQALIEALNTILTFAPTSDDHDIMEERIEDLGATIEGHSLRRHIASLDGADLDGLDDLVGSCDKVFG